MEIPVHLRDGSYFNIHVRKTLIEKQSPYQKIVVYDTEEFGKCLFLNGIIQFSEKDHEIYDTAILKKLSKNDHEIIILGGGDGNIATTAIRMNPDLRITVVDIDRDVVEISKTYIHQNVFDNSGINIIINDALSFLKESQKRGVDGIVVDLTDTPILPGGEIDNIYVELLPLAKRILKSTAWISIYTGDYPDVIKEMMDKYFNNIEVSNVFIPSFGEDAIFIHGMK